MSCLCAPALIFKPLVSSFAFFHIECAQTLFADDFLVQAKPKSQLLIDIENTVIKNTFDYFVAVVCGGRFLLFKRYLLPRLCDIHAGLLSKALECLLNYFEILCQFIEWNRL